MAARVAIGTVGAAFGVAESEDAGVGGDEASGLAEGLGDASGVALASDDGGALGEALSVGDGAAVSAVAGPTRLGSFSAGTVVAGDGVSIGAATVRSRSAGRIR
jgi:hypothetical protein